MASSTELAAGGALKRRAASSGEMLAETAEEAEGLGDGSRDRDPLIADSSFLTSVLPSCTTLDSLSSCWVRHPSSPDQMPVLLSPGPGGQGQWKKAFEPMLHQMISGRH